MDGRRVAAAVLGALMLAALGAAPAAALETKGPARQPVLPRFDDGFEAGGIKEEERLCAEKTAQTLPLTEVAVGSLSLGQITLHTEGGYYTVMLPLRQPKKMKSLYWGADTLEEVTTFIKLLQEGKLLSVKANAFAAGFRKETKLTGADLNACARDQMKDLLEPCQDCEIVEWVFKGRAE